LTASPPDLPRHCIATSAERKQALLAPKFAHGVFDVMNSGLQAVDILLDGKVMQSNSRYKKAEAKY
jgi:hypothetical protein